MVRVALTLGVVLLAQPLPSSADAVRGTSQAAPTAVSHEDFVRLSPDERRERFAGMRPEDRALLVRTHAQRWLTANRARLTSSELAVFEEMVAFIRPELYVPGPNPTLDEEERALRARMRCRVNPEDVRVAFKVVDPSPNAAALTPTWTFLDRAACWLEWAAEGIAPYVRD